MSLHDSTLTTIRGEQVSLADYRDRVVLIVNVASRCGLTPQYAQLEDLQHTYGPRGFAVLGFPSDDFRQELATREEIEGAVANRGRAGFVKFHDAASRVTTRTVAGKRKSGWVLSTAWVCSTVRWSTREAGFQARETFTFG